MLRMKLDQFAHALDADELAHQLGIVLERGHGKILRFNDDLADVLRHDAGQRRDCIDLVLDHRGQSTFCDIFFFPGVVSRSGWIV